MSIEAYQQVIDEIGDAAVISGRSPKEILLIAVSKGNSWDDSSFLYDCGQRDFGESRISEALLKQEMAPPDCRWHLIGTLQSNKVKKVIGRFALIHSVDSIALARRLSTCSLEMGITTHVLLQANCSGETTKHGLIPEEWIHSFEELLEYPSLSIDGLMTMAPIPSEESTARKSFARLRHLRDQLQKIAGSKANLHELSMGMSNDFRWAIAEGATIVRVGSRLYTGSNSI